MVCNNGSSISIRGNGFFDGSYSNYEMSNTGSGYPNGTTYVCDFDGKFNVTDIGKYSVTLKLASLKTDQTSGKSWTSGGIKYIASKPYGLENCKYFILYIPGTTDNMLPEDITNLNRGISNGILNCYVLYNPSTGAAFFSY